MSAGIKMEYVPNFNMFIDFIIDRTSYSSNRFIEYIKDIITTTKIQEQINGFTNYNESEAVENSPVKNSSVENSHTLFNKIQTIINMFLIKYWYTNGNTINVKI
jgi:hypothetical protein